MGILGLPRDIRRRVLHFQILLPPSAAVPHGDEALRRVWRVVRVATMDHHVHVYMQHEVYMCACGIANVLCSKSREVELFLSMICFAVVHETRLALISKAL